MKKGPSNILLLEVARMVTLHFALNMFNIILIKFVECFIGIFLDPYGYAESEIKIVQAPIRLGGCKIILNAFNDRQAGLVLLLLRHNDVGLQLD